MNQRILQSFLACAALSVALPSLAQPYTIGPSTVDGGGGSCSGGVTSAGGTRFALAGTVGQSDTANSTGGTFTLQGGFVPGSTKTVTPPLTMTRVGTQLTFTWPNFCTGFVLEGASALDAQVWTPLGSGNVVGPNRRVVISSFTSPAFFRLRKDCPK